DADAVATHLDRTGFAVRAEEGGPHGRRVLRPEIEDLPDLDPAMLGEPSSFAAGAGVVTRGLAQVREFDVREVPLLIDADHVLIGTVGPGHETSAGAERQVCQ